MDRTLRLPAPNRRFSMSTNLAAVLCGALALLVPTRAATAADAPYLDLGRAYSTPPMGATVSEWSRHAAVDPAPSAAPDIYQCRAHPIDPARAPRIVEDCFALDVDPGSDIASFWAGTDAALAVDVPGWTHAGRGFPCDPVNVCAVFAVMPGGDLRWRARRRRWRQRGRWPPCPGRLGRM